MDYVYVPNIVEGNGKTIRENNLEKQHSIPKGTLVEVNIPYSEHHGIRLFVTHYERDCDGSPLYGLYHKPEFDPLDVDLFPNAKHLDRFRFVSGFSDDCLIVISREER